MKKFILSLIISSVVLASCKDDDKKEKEYTIEKIETTRDSVSYALGVSIADNFKKMKIDTTIDEEVFIAAISEYFSGKEKISAEKAQKFLDNYFMALYKADSEHQQPDNKEFEAQLKVLEEKEKLTLDSIGKNTPGIQTSESGLMYLISNKGKGVFATEKDTVQIEYVGKLSNGEEFDLSKPGKPRTFILGEVIPGFTEGLQKIKEGGKIRLFIPSKLGYGNSDQGPIPPYSTLIFDITLVKVIPKK
jgi:FKBP-type peptidyl-prolyl cis-trans isomerase FkpA